MATKRSHLLTALTLLCSFGTLMGPVASASAPASGWGIATLIETYNVGNAAAPQLAVDPAGNAVAVWAQSDGCAPSAWANRFVPGVGWGSAELLEGDCTGSVADTSVAVDGSGNAFALWSQSDGIRYNIWWARYVPGIGWGSPALLETENSGDAGLPAVAFDPSGNAMAVWDQWDGAGYHDWASRFIVGTGWSAPAEIATPPTSPGLRPRVGLDSAGDAVAVWNSVDGNIWTNRFVPGTGWGTAVLLETIDTGSANDPVIAVERGGTATAVWDQWDGVSRNVWANRFVPGAGWGTGVLIETDNSGGANLPAVAVDDAGTVVTVWEQADMSRTNIWANRYAAGAGWGTATLIETADTGDAGGAQVAMDSSGNAVAVWYQWDGMRWNVLANRFVPGSGWGVATFIETQNVGGAYSPQVACDPAGNAVVVFHASDGLGLNVYANRFAAPDLRSPVLSLDAPAEGLSTNRSTVWVAGTTEPGATVSANGNLAAVAPNGSFGISVAASPGANLITVGAWDASGNAAWAFANVTVSDPTVDLQQDLQAAVTNLSVARAQVNALQVDLNATKAQMASAMADLVSLRTRADSLSASLNTTQASLATTQSDLATTRAALNATQPTGGASPPASDSSMLALVIAVVGVGLGAAGIAVGMRKKPAPPA